VNRTLLALIALLSCLACAATAAGSGGARVVKYSETDIVPIRAKVRFTTLIVLPAQEDILDFTVGDKDFWIVNGIHNLCYLHPAQASIRSNMNLVTASGHVYSFMLSEISNQPDADPDLKVFVEPREESALGGIAGHAAFVRASELEAYKNKVDEERAQAAKQVQQSEAHAREEIEQFRKDYPTKLQFDYTYKPEAAKPPFLIAAIYHDDKFTYIKCSAQEKPAIYELKDAKPNLVNFDLENGVYIIPKIVDHGYLAVGKKKVSFDREAGS